MLLRFLGRRLAGAGKSMLPRRESVAHVKGALSSGLSIAMVASSLKIGKLTLQKWLGLGIAALIRVNRSQTTDYAR
jgi:hypothetical protein